MAKPIFLGAAELPQGKGGDGLVHLEALKEGDAGGRVQNFQCGL